MTRFAMLRSQLAQNVGRLLVDRRGATAIEYGLMVALISVAIITTVFGIGSGLSTTLYGGIVTGLQNAGNK